MDAINYWRKELANKSPSTIKKYERYFLKFCEFVNSTPDEILDLRKEDLMKLDDPKTQRRFETHLKEFIAHLNSKGFSISTQQVAFAATKSFFEMHYLPLVMRKSDYPSGESLGYRSATKDDILKLIEDADVRLKAIVLFLKDSGLRVSDLIRLTYGNVKKGIEDNSDFIGINLITKKNNISARTFIGPESIASLKEYLEHRKIGTDKIPAEEITDDSPLFRTRERKVNPITRSSLSSTITHRVYKVGLGNEISAHSFRKYFQTQLEASGVSPNWIDQMIGHKLPDMNNSYSRPTESQLREAYEKSYQSLNVFPIPATVEEMRKQADELKGAKDQISQLQKEVEDLKKLLELYPSIIEVWENLSEDKKEDFVQLAKHKGVKVTRGDGSNKRKAEAKRKIVKEEELEMFPEWNIEAPLSGGKYAIRRVFH